MKATVIAFVGLLLVQIGLFAHPEALEIGPASTKDLPTGKEADGIIGDFVLRNDHVHAVISGNLPLRRANMSTFYGTNGISPGCLYDLAFRENGNDQITIFSPSEQRGAVSLVRIVKATGEEAEIETVVSAASNGGLFKRHSYSLTEDSVGVLIKTTLHNQGSDVVKQKVYDRWTAFASVTNQFGAYRWADAVDPADRVGYAFRPTIPEGGDGSEKDEVSLKAGEQLEISRFLAIGHSPAEAVGRAAAQAGETGNLNVEVHDGAGNGIAGAVVRIATLSEPIQSVPAYADQHGVVKIPFLPGRYKLTAEDLGRASASEEIEVLKDGAASIAFQLSGKPIVHFQITDRDGRDIPCKAQFIGIEGTPTPNLGPPNRAHGCKEQFHSERGQFSTALPPGKYRVVVTRGIEYSHLIREIQVNAGETINVTGQLERLVNTSGWVSADYHNHSTQSGDNTCGTDDRIANLVAEHIEFAPTTEHNRHYDWRPHIEKLGVARFLQTVSGIELTGSGPHLNSFPFHPHPHIQDNGAPIWNRDPRISALLLRNHQQPNPDRWIQINHPELIENFIDANGDGLADGGYMGLGGLIDGVEVQNFGPSSLLSKVPVRVYGTNVVPAREFLWLQLLNRGHRLVGMAVSDAHSVHGNGVGGWRMYLPSKSDEPAEIDWKENSRHAKAGRSILTTGPFLEVRTPDGAGPGAEVRSSGGLELQIKVQCTDWIDIDRVQILVNGQQRPEVNFTRKTHPDLFKNGVLKFEHKVWVPLSEDAHLIVVAAHEEKDLSVGYGASDQSRLRPIAYNNPIYVDVDGSGWKANGDMLGYSLGVGKIPLERAQQMLEREKPAAK